MLRFVLLATLVALVAASYEYEPEDYSGSYEPEYEAAGYVEGPEVSYDEPVESYGGYNEYSNFLQLYRQYESSYSRYFYGYCNKYIAAHPDGRYSYYARQYLKAFKRYSSSSYAGGRYANFLTLYGRYRPTYNKYFYQYCNRYLSAHPRGQYVSYARQYVNLYKNQFLGARPGDFYDLFKKYHKSYSHFFYNYCNKYVGEHPSGKYTVYARQYLRTYRRYYAAGGAATGVINGGRFANFLGLYKQNRRSYSRSFYTYCTSYLAAHPSGQYIRYAQRYVNTYKSRYSGSYMAYSPVVGNRSFIILYRKYRSRYSKFFYNYCNRYISSHPDGQYYSIASAYVTSYRNRYSGRYDAGYEYPESYSGGYTSGDYTSDYDIPIDKRDYRTSY